MEICDIYYVSYFLFTPVDGWQQIDDFRVPEAYFQHLLSKLGSPYLDTQAQRQPWKLRRKEHFLDLKQKKGQKSQMPVIPVTLKIKVSGASISNSDEAASPVKQSVLNGKRKKDSGYACLRKTICDCSAKTV